MKVQSDDTSLPSESAEENPSVIPGWLVWLVIFVGLLTVVMLIMYIATFGIERSMKQDVWGQFGDFFGGVLNPLLSSLALAAVLVTLRVQAQDLKEAQRENRQTNRHLNDQAQYIRLQSFESVFFRLLDLHLKAKDEFTYSAQGVNFKGLAAFDIVGDELSNFELHVLSECDVSESNDSPGLITTDFEGRFGNIFSTYFRSMYQILKYVDAYNGFNNYLVETSVPPNYAGVRLESQQESYILDYRAKRQYVNMLRAQMDQSERRVLFASCLTDKGAGLKFYVEKYSLLKGMNMQRTALTDEKAKQFYNESAFSGEEDMDYIELMERDRSHKVTS